MRDSKRIKPFLEKLENIWMQVPDWRFGQLMCNFERLNGDPFYLEEDDFIQRLETYLDCVKAKFVCSFYDETGERVVAFDDFNQNSANMLKKLYNADSVIKYKDYPRE